MRELPQPLHEHQEIVERTLRQHVESASSSGLPLYRMMQYQLGWVDRDGLEQPGARSDRFLGALCVEAALSVDQGTSRDVAALSAVAAELLQQSVTVHEDMQVAEPHTEGRPAVWWIWGPAQAINIGDGLHALARLAVFRLRDAGLSGEQVLAVVGDLDAAALRYYEGQYLELTYQERMDITEAQYVNMASGKRGALFAGAAALGARAAGSNEERVAAFRSFGEKLGLAAQMKEDVDAIWSRDGRHEGTGRLLNKSKLYPVVHALETGPISRKRALGGIYFKRVMEPKDLAELQTILDEAGVREHSQAQAEAHATEALDLLRAAGVSPGAMVRWQTVAESLVTG